MKLLLEGNRPWNPTASSPPASPKAEVSILQTRNPSQGISLCHDWDEEMTKEDTHSTFHYLLKATSQVLGLGGMGEEPLRNFSGWLLL